MKLKLFVKGGVWFGYEKPDLFTSQRELSKARAKALKVFNPEIIIHPSIFNTITFEGKEFEWPGTFELDCCSGGTIAGYVLSLTENKHDKITPKRAKEIQEGIDWYRGQPEKELDDEFWL